MYSFLNKTEFFKILTGDFLLLAPPRRNLSIQAKILNSDFLNLTKYKRCFNFSGEV